MQIKKEEAVNKFHVRKDTNDGIHDDWWLPTRYALAQINNVLYLLDSFSFTAELSLEVYFPFFSPDDGIAIGAGIGYRGFVPMFDYIPRDEDFRSSFGYVNAVLTYFHKS